MRKYRIRGETRIAGAISIGGGKNAVLPILAALVMCKGETIIHNCPRIADTMLSIDILRHVGCKVTFEGNTLVVDATHAHTVDIPEEPVRKMRSSILFMGAMLARFGQVNINYPGGCVIGDRPINLHLQGLRAMGADICEAHGYLRCEAKPLVGARIHMDEVSVGATENVLLAAVLAKGLTVITNAAREPEIIDLADCLTGMGAKVYGAGTDTIYVEGVAQLHGTTHTVMPDRIVAGTYLLAAAMTEGDVHLTHVQPKHLTAVTAKLETMGCRITETTDTIHLRAPKHLQAIRKLTTEVYPGFPTDMQAQFVAALTLARGVSMVEERIFESRSAHAPELVRMGADITLSSDGRVFVIKGRPRLQGATVVSKDLRGGAALMLAAVAAQGETILLDDHYIERGYERMAVDLAQLGACLSVDD